MDGDRQGPLGLVKSRGIPAVLVSLAVFALTACSSARQEADALAATRQLTPQVIDAGYFDLLTYVPRSWTPQAPLNVYIEGDGYAWIRRDRLSDDPTPRKPVALELAVQDRSPNVIYIARPCQYVTGQARRHCAPDYWSVARYSEEAVAAIDQAIEHFRRLSGSGKIRLYGYSGGGTIALLVAARRKDVERVVTVAGVLDTAAWTRHHDITPLYASFNPADFVQALSGVPQTHFSGNDDKVVPRDVAQSYLRRFPEGQTPRLAVVPGQEHDCCWADVWPKLLSGL
ncbi:MAG: alpha/beta hydrolase [Rhodospirillales bacterium]|jgi:pimeloyl-ACP methyl ester carboxylesterase|nr:alpha/beta hydrolase [Rhodospirillales bacterium]